MGRERGYSQNGGVLIVLVGLSNDFEWNRRQSIKVIQNGVKPFLNEIIKK